MKTLYNTIILSFLTCSLTQVVLGQFSCDVVESDLKSSGVIADYQDYIPDGDTPVKYIRMNFHFMLLEDTHPDYPGNFTPFDDGRGDTTFTAYDFAEDLLYWTNFRLASNEQMLYPLGNSTPVISRKYRFVLNGIFFHENNTYYWYPSSPVSYSENVGEAINVFFQSDGTTNSHGYANMSGNRYTVHVNKWDVYNWCLEEEITWGNWANAGGLMHETGHNLSLLHTMMTSGGTCSDVADDYCTDTPTRGYVKLHDGVDPCCQGCQWANDTNSNNIMEYSGATAITPEQLGRVHWTIENEMEAYQTYYYSASYVNITNFTDNAAYIAESVVVPSYSDIKVDDNKALFINCDELYIDGAFEIKPGARLYVNPVPKCN